MGMSQMTGGPKRRDRREGWLREVGGSLGVEEKSDRRMSFCIMCGALEPLRRAHEQYKREVNTRVLSVMGSKCTNYNGETTEYCLTDSFIFYHLEFCGE